MTKSRWYRCALSLLLVIVMALFWSTRIDELFYHTVGKTELIDLGDATLYSQTMPDAPANSFVSISGILGNKAATLRGLRAGSFRYGRYQVRHLLGSKIYIEYKESQYHSSFNPFTRVSVQGRLVPFGPDSELSKVRAFFKEYYNLQIDDKAMLIVVDEKPRNEIIYSILFLLSLLLTGLSIFSTYRQFKKPHEEVLD